MKAAARDTFRGLLLWWWLLILWAVSPHVVAQNSIPAPQGEVDSLVVSLAWAWHSDRCRVGAASWVETGYMHRHVHGWALVLIGWRPKQ
jgi:hypothetical protein